MVGIVSYGAYIPFYRLNREEIGRAWDVSTIGGEKAVANYDEDSLTMGVAAGLDCVGGCDQSNIGGLYFATTTSPYKEKQIATTAALAIDLPKEIRTADFTDSLRAGTNAFGSAIDTIKGGTTNNTLVIAADCRLGAPKGQYEQLFGDGAAAILLGNSGVIARIEGSYSISNEFTDIWRENNDSYVRWWEDRFILSIGYQSIVQEAVSSLMKKHNLTARDFTKAILYAPNPRSHAALAKSLGFDTKTQVQDPLLTTVGNTGAASVLMMLVSALQDAKPNDKFLLASYGDGCDVYILEITDEIRNIKNRRGTKQYLASKMMLKNYEQYQTLRQLIPTEHNPVIQTVVATAPAMWRERKKNIAFFGSKCLKCGTPQFPPQRICTFCQQKDEMEDYKFADKKGEIFSFTYQYAAPIPDPPLAYAIVDFEGGGRILSEVTDRDISQLMIGMPVEMTFRKMQIPGSFHDYYWKARPIRGES
jgi:3-hydroxy-3-methylglutaryl CoA synthase